MAQAGEIVFYTKQRLDHPVLVLRRIAGILQAKDVQGAWRTKVEDTGWDCFLRGDDEVPTDFFYDALSIEEFEKLYVPPTSLSGKLRDSPVAARIYGAIEGTIPATIRGEFRPNEVFVTMGFHDLFEWSEHDEGLLFARAFLSIHFNGYGTPYDWPAFRQTVFAIPEVRSVKRELEAVIGPLEECVYWNI